MRKIALFSLATLALAFGLTGCTVKTKKPAKGPRAHKAAKATKKAAKKGKWVFLGERKVDFKAERDVIAVTAAKGVFKKIQLRIKGRAVHFLDLEVVYGNGETHDVKIRKLIPKGGQTRVIDLPGNNRIIRKVKLTYRSAAKKKNKGKKNRPGKAHVRLFGRR
jgi:hypothetical protein